MDEEKTWILQAQQGSDEAFTYLVETYQKPVYNLCYRMLGEADWAEDAAQESFLRAYKNLHRYDANRSFATWLLSIAAHYCIDKLRRKKLPTFSLHDDEGDPREYIPDARAVLPEKAAIYSDQQAQIEAMLNELSELDRAAIVLRYWHDASEVEIAETLDITVSAVKSRLHRARRKLGELWEEDPQPSQSMERMPYGSPAF